MKHKNKHSPKKYDKVIIENCINAFVDSDNSVKGMWDTYIRPLVDSGQITEPYAQQKAREALDVVIPTYKQYKKIIGE